MASRYIALIPAYEPDRKMLGVIADLGKTRTGDTHSRQHSARHPRDLRQAQQPDRDLPDRRAPAPRSDSLKRSKILSNPYAKVMLRTTGRTNSAANRMQK